MSAAGAASLGIAPVVPDSVVGWTGAGPADNSDVACGDMLGVAVSPLPCSVTPPSSMVMLTFIVLDSFPG